jgi:hypothetical protein
MGVPILGVHCLSILGVPTWELETKWHLDVGPVARHRKYYKGEGDDFPQVQAVVNFVSPCLFVTRLCTKSFQLCINQLIVWFVQVSVNNWHACYSFYNPILELQHALLPPSVAR